MEEKRTLNKTVPLTILMDWWTKSDQTENFDYIIATSIKNQTGPIIFSTHILYMASFFGKSYYFNFIWGKGYFQTENCHLQIFPKQVSSARNRYYFQQVSIVACLHTRNGYDSHFREYWQQKNINKNKYTSKVEGMRLTGRGGRGGREVVYPSNNTQPGSLYTDK